MVTDNGSCYKSADFATFIGKRPELTHVRTRHYASQTNGVIERFNQSLKCEHLYRHEIADGQELTELVNTYLETYNTIRPHEELDLCTPSDIFGGRFVPNPKSPNLSKILDTGHIDATLLRILGRAE